LTNNVKTKLKGYNTAICKSAKYGIPLKINGFQNGNIPLLNITEDINLPG
jgi:hypothetical protein